MMRIFLTRIPYSCLLLTRIETPYVLGRHQAMLVKSKIQSTKNDTT